MISYKVNERALWFFHEARFYLVTYKKRQVISVYLKVTLRNNDLTRFVDRSKEGEEKLPDCELSEYQLNALGRATAKAVYEYYKNPENIKKFEKWFFEKHGYTYEEHRRRKAMSKNA